jgi:hypothetical protein
MPPRHSRKRMARIFRGFRSGHHARSPEPEGAGSTVTPIGLHALRADIFRNSGAAKLREVVSARRRANALWRSLPKPSWMGRLCNAEDFAAMIGCLGRPGFDRRSHQVLAPSSGTRLCVVRRSLEPKLVWWRTFAGSDKRRHTGAGAQGSLSRANR